MQNPTQVEDFSTLYSSIKSVVMFFVTSYFFLYSLGLFILTHIFGSYAIFNLTNNLPFQLSIAIGSVVLAYFTISHDITKWKKQQQKVNKPYMITIIIFLFISLYTEIIFFVIENIELMVNSIGSDIMREEGKLRFLQAQITSVAIVYNYLVFTKGKHLWKWITKRDPIIDQINDKFYP